MQVVHTLLDLQHALKGRTQRVLVPTMGNLHEGHLSLVRKAQTLGQTTIATIFVNRLQFLPHEDFDAYPRTLSCDLALLQAQGCDIVFAPTEHDLYPEPQTFTVQPDPALASILEGHFRPGFFTGVCTVVMKLLACTQPQAAVFGEKDYQQLLIIRRMVAQFALPIDIVGMPTARDADGLALSSRNRFLSAPARNQAAALAQCLSHMADQVRQGVRDWAWLEAEALQRLRAQGWAPDYLTVRQQSNLALAPSEALAPLPPLVALGAARLGDVRLIDNLPFVAPAAPTY